MLVSIKKFIIQILLVSCNQVLLQGYNGSQLWDTAFAVQAIISSNLTEEYGPTLRKAHSFVKNSQVSFYSYQYVMCWFALVDQNLFSFFLKGFRRLSR